MPKITPPSSPPLSSLKLSSESTHNSSHRSSPQLPYRKIESRPELLGIGQNQPNNHSVRPSSPIAAYDDLDTNLLAAFKDLRESSESSGIDSDLASEAAADQAFL